MSTKGKLKGIPTGKDSKTYKYYADKAEKYKRLSGGASGEVLEFAYNMIFSLKKTRTEAIEYVKWRKNLSYKERGQNPKEFLVEVNKFLSTVTDKELMKILANPADRLPLNTRIANIVDRILEDPDREKHRGGYVKGLINLIK